MAERGGYRAIARVLLDGKDFQRLPERARWVFVAMKLNLGPAGIEVHYRGALAHQLAEQTGAPVEGVHEALDVLEEEGWIRIEGNVVWIIEQLRYDPHMKVTHEKHRKSIQNHVAGLPRLAIVREFCEHYADWFRDAPEGLLTPLGRPSEGPDKALDRPSEGPDKALDRPSPLPNTEERKAKAAAARTGAHTRDGGPAPPAESGDDCRFEEAITEIIRAANRGMRDNPQIGERFRPIDAGHGTSRQAVYEWLNAGVPPELAKELVYQRARTWKRNGRQRQITSMAYFTDAVLEAYAANGAKLRLMRGGDPAADPARSAMFVTREQVWEENRRLEEGRAE